eukprot:SAG22_NODE_3030_length_2013_cov_2.535005_2_plen_405_part_00
MCLAALTSAPSLCASCSGHNNRRNIKLLDTHFAKYDSVLRERIRKETRRKETTEQTQCVVDLVAATLCIESSVEQPVIYHERVDAQQRVFNQLILDQRTKEGQFVRKLQALVNGQDQPGGDKPAAPAAGAEGGEGAAGASGADGGPAEADAHEPLSPDAITTTIDHMVEVMSRDHLAVGEAEHEPKRLGILRLYVHRAVYPLIAPMCFRLAADDGADSNEEFVQYRDAVFRRQLRHLAGRSQAAIGVEPAFCKPPADADDLFGDEDDADDGTPYAAAARILCQLTAMVVPADMMYCLLRTGRAIYKLAHEYAARHQAAKDAAAGGLKPGIKPKDPPVRTAPPPARPPARLFPLARSLCACLSCVRASLRSERTRACGSSILRDHSFGVCRRLGPTSSSRSSCTW